MHSEVPIFLRLSSNKMLNVMKVKRMGGFTSGLGGASAPPKFLKQLNYNLLYNEVYTVQYIEYNVRVQTHVHCVNVYPFMCANCKIYTVPVRLVLIVLKG